MTRTSYRPLAAVGLVVALLAYVGCSKDHAEKAGSASTAQSKPETPPNSQAAEGSSTKLFQNWTTPAGAMLISGEQDGYLEPCGCTQGQQGGLLRRYDMVERLRAQQWPLALIDLGSLIKDPAGSRGGMEESKIKFATALKAVVTMRYNALALGAEDLKVGVFEALGHFLNDLGETTKVVAANVEAPGFESRVAPSVRTKVGPVSIGITAVLDPETLKKVSDPDKDTLLKVRPIGDSLPAVLADLEKDTQYQVLMVQGPPEEAKTLAEAYPGFDIVVGTSHVDPKKDADELNGGKTLLVNVGKKGKYVGVIGFFPNDTKPLRYQSVPLNSRYDGAAQPMKEIVEVEYRGMLKVARVVENFPRHDYINGAPGAKFLGAETCKSCHPKTYAKWASTQHALAFESLENDPRPDTTFDAECISCHTTGFEYNSGYKSAELTPNLMGNQCENCHGPASKHVANPDDRDLRKFLAMTAEGANQTRQCLKCHDEDNSPHFDFDKYYRQITHKGLDTYDNPEVHISKASFHGAR